MTHFAFLQTLRGKVLLVLAAVALVPSLLLGGLGLVSVRGLGGVARTQARLAVEQELRQRLAGRAQERARATDSLFRGVLAQAVSLSQYVTWYYDNPAHIPAPGYLRGGSDLVQTAGGHWVNQPETPVGVFVSRKAQLTTPVWQEVGLLSFADPLITSIRQSTPGADRAWVTSATRIVRIAPNVGLGQPGSSVGPDYDLTEDEPFQRAAPERNPHRLPVWTVPYVDPVSGELMITAAAPVYGGEGAAFRAVAAVEMRLAGVLQAVLEAETEGARYAMLLDPSASLIGAPERAYRDLGLPAPAPGAGAVPGRAVVTPLETSAAPGVRELAGALRGATEPGLVAFGSSDGGARLAACAPLPATGWVYCLVAPASELAAAAGPVQSAIGRLEGAYVAGGLLGTLGVLALVVWAANRAAGLLTRPVAQLVAGTRLLSRDLSHRLPPLAPQELDLLAKAFNSMAGSLQRSRDEAVRGARMVVEERNRLAREIHDTIAQGLTGIVVHLETTESILGTGADPDALRHLHRARGLARESLQEARRSVLNLRPSAVEEVGLATGLEQLGAALQGDGIDCVVSAADAPNLAPAAADALYRVCQEALANVRRHSGATHCEVQLWAEGDEAVLRVSDNGRGFDPGARAGPTQAGGFGLWAMEERVSLVGGRLTVQSRPGGGTAVTARVPVLDVEVPDGAGNQGAGGR
jgi:signal transduction histidine kinase